MSDRQYLNPLEVAPKAQTPIRAFDVETTGDNNRFVMGSIVGDGTLRGAAEVYWNRQDMIDALLSYRFRSGYIYAHNLEFDALALLQDGGIEYIEDTLGYDVEIFHNGASIIYVKVRDESDHVWEFRDSMNVAMHTSVADMGDIIDMPKLSTIELDGQEYVIDLAENDTTDYPKDVMEAYNIRDSKICYRFVSWLRDQLHDLGGELEITAAKTAMQLYRREYLEEALEQPRRDILERTYEGYYGGRVSPIVKGHVEGPVYEYDVASLYPYCMTQISVPDPASLRYDRGNGKYTEATQRKRIWDTEGMSKITIEAPDMDIPVLPTKWEDKLLFPTGEITDWWCHNEIRFALEHGYQITEVHESIWGTETRKPFEGYVNDLFSKRLQYRDEGNDTEFVVKLMMNSLYGKFGQRIEIEDGGLYKRMTDVEDVSDLTGSRAYGDWVIEALEGDKVPSYINPLIAAYVTAEGRKQLYQWFEYVQNQGGRVLYCDTDSVWTDTKLPEVSDEKVLGDLDYEGAYDDLYVFGPKMYVADKEDDTKITAKGVPYGQMQDMWDAIQDGDDRISYEKMASMREGWRADDYDPLEVIETSRKVDIAQESNRKHVGGAGHRTMLSDEVTTEPFNLNNLQQKVAKEKAAVLKQQRLRQGSDAFEAQAVGDKQLEDASAYRDSTLTAGENKEVLWRNRKEKAKDRDM